MQPGSHRVAAWDAHRQSELPALCLELGHLERVVVHWRRCRRVAAAAAGVAAAAAGLGGGGGRRAASLTPARVQPLCCARYGYMLTMAAILTTVMLTVVLICTQWLYLLLTSPRLRACSHSAIVAVATGHHGYMLSMAIPTTYYLLVHACARAATGRARRSRRSRLGCTRAARAASPSCSGGGRGG